MVTSDAKRGRDSVNVYWVLIYIAEFLLGALSLAKKAIFFGKEVSLSYPWTPIGTKRMKNTRNVCLAYAKWRIQLHRSQKPRLTVRFFRRSRNHSLIWNFVMQGYFEGTPRTLGECEDIAAWSRPTTRKLLNEARLRGFLDIRPSEHDQRKRLVFPTPLTISEYESMVKGHMDFVTGLKTRKATGKPSGR